ncbi:MAG: A/G-specific adenine glycosylase [Patescibacteria group bacterium]|mgnify:CR=1 FL=1
MLQQTQVSRVIPKFATFIKAYPSFEALAVAPLSEVLRMWSGLGYNRRAKFLLQTAQLVTGQYSGHLPNRHADLVALPGVGHNTAGAIRAYAFNEPAVFVETNIRTVFIHHFFGHGDKVSDAVLLPLIQESTPVADVRGWYWALMDYGTHLKQTVGNVSQASATYTKQSAFHGSKRRIRGQVIRLLTRRPHTFEGLDEHISDGRLRGVLDDLMQEGFIECADSYYHLRA